MYPWLHQKNARGIIKLMRFFLKAWDISHWRISWSWENQEIGFMSDLKFINNIRFILCSSTINRSSMSYVKYRVRWSNNVVMLCFMSSLSFLPSSSLCKNLIFAEVLENLFLFACMFLLRARWSSVSWHFHLLHCYWCVSFFSSLTVTFSAFVVHGWAGRFLAELTKEVFSDLAASKYQVLLVPFIYDFYTCISILFSLNCHCLGFSAQHLQAFRCTSWDFLFLHFVLLLPFLVFPLPGPGG